MNREQTEWELKKWIDVRRLNAAITRKKQDGSKLSVISQLIGVDEKTLYLWRKGRIKQASLRHLRNAENILGLEENALALDYPQELPPSLSISPDAHNLPNLTNSLVGRLEELETTRDLLLDRQVRLVSLTGPGGIGKTRLALEVARSVLPGFQSGVFFVALDRVNDPDLVCPAIMRALGILETSHLSPKETLANHLKDKQLLLVLDCFERIVASATDILSLLLSCPDLKVLVTSRELLNISGEYEISVPPLALPSSESCLTDLEKLAEYASVSLFIQRAREHSQTFDLTEENAATIVAICERLDALPLAIELAAARVKLLSPQEMLKRISVRFDWLSGGARDLPERHRTLYGTIEWSVELLDVEERRLFTWLSVFEGGFTLETVEEFCSHENISVALLPESDRSIMDIIASLVSKSLLQQSESQAGNFRFSMLDSIREYGLTRLARSGHSDTIFSVYFDTYLAIAVRVNEPYQNRDQRTWLNDLAVEHDNFNAVLRNIYGQYPKHIEIALNLVGHLWRFWEIRGYFATGRQHIDRILNHPTHAHKALSAEALTAIGTLAWNQGDYESAAKYHADALAVYTALQDKRGIAFATNNLGVQALDSMDLQNARSLVEKCLMLAEDIQENSLIIYASHNLGEISRHEGDYKSAIQWYERSLSLCQEEDETWGAAIQLNALGTTWTHLGEHLKAISHLEQSVMMFQSIGDEGRIAECLETIAEVAITIDHYEQAVLFLCVSSRLRNDLNVPRRPPEQDRLTQIENKCKQHLTSTVYETLLDSSQNTTIETALSEVTIMSRDTHNQSNQENQNMYSSIGEAD